jgi:hypothetical protein
VTSPIATISLPDRCSTARRPRRPAPIGQAEAKVQPCWATMTARVWMSPRRQSRGTPLIPLADATSLRCKAQEATAFSIALLLIRQFLSRQRENLARAAVVVWRGPHEHRRDRLIKQNVPQVARGVHPVQIDSFFFATGPDIKLLSAEWLLCVVSEFFASRLTVPKDFWSRPLRTRVVLHRNPGAAFLQLESQVIAPQRSDWRCRRTRH